MSRDSLSSLRKAYAEAMGISARTAQRHSKPGDVNHSKWLRFIGEEAAAAVEKKSEDGAISKEGAKALALVSPLAPAELPAFYHVSDTDLSPEQIKEKQAFEIFQRTYQDWADTLDSAGKVQLRVVLLQQLPSLQQNYERAKKAREEWEVKNRYLFPISEFNEFVATYLVPLAEVLRNLKSELPVHLNPENPEYARQKMVEYEADRLGPSIRRLLDGAAEFVDA